ncbi:MAG: YggT family protein [Patescibacteria group bacterium]
MAIMYRDARDTGVVGTGAGYVTTTIARVVSLIGGLITAVLALRFILVLLGANPANAFANFIYSVSRPFVTPFYGLFNYNGELGIARFEFETLIAIVFWAVITWMVVRLLTVGARD